MIQSHLVVMDMVDWTVINVPEADNAFSWLIHHPLQRRHNP